MTPMVDLVADLGEGFGAYTMGDDEALLETLTSANVACGFHAGDPRIMDATVRHCVAKRVAVGAHPSFPDLVGFGRRAMDLTPEEVRTDVLYQIGALQAFAVAHGTRVRHVAPHGRLGNLVAVRPDYARAVVEAVASLDESLIILAQDGELADAARVHGLRVGIVGIADRAYRADGTLVPRSEPGAVIHEPDEVSRRTLRMVTEGVIRSVDGTDVPVTCDTVLLHGDSPGAIALAGRVREGLLAAGVAITSLDAVLSGKGV
ncbi:MULTISPECIES: LamB/YcsF family protein [unclassified Streptomyces]|uniref:LamB/YcsF family protein n=1 Tax=unclassified Streptomyces TaxID=2593676 RepID=UPI0036343015